MCALIECIMYIKEISYTHTYLTTDWLTCDKLSYFSVHCCSQQAKQCRNSTCISHGNLVVVCSSAINEVPQGSACVPLHLQDLMIQQIHQVFYSIQTTHLQNTRDFHVVKGMLKQSALKVRFFISVPT